MPTGVKLTVGWSKQMGAGCTRLAAGLCFISMGGRMKTASSHPGAPWTVSLIVYVPGPVKFRYGLGRHSGCMIESTHIHEAPAPLVVTVQTNPVVFCEPVEIKCPRAGAQKSVIWMAPTAVGGGSTVMLDVKVLEPQTLMVVSEAGNVPAIGN